jgi:biopolymer transport protein ExbD
MIANLVRTMKALSLVLPIFLFSCGQTRTGSAVKQDSTHLNCIVLGYDSIIYYVGSGNSFMNIQNGNCLDSAFVNRMFRQVKEQHFIFSIKPGGGGNVVQNFSDLIMLAKSQEVPVYSLDTINENEQKEFHISTPPSVRNAMRGVETQPLKLYLPRGSDNPNAKDSLPEASRMTILLSDNVGLFAFMRGDMQKGKIYSSEELIKLLKTNNTLNKFHVLIKPSVNSSYKSLVDALDMMTIAGIKRYALVDISKDEEDYLKKLQH